MMIPEDNIQRHGSQMNLVDIRSSGFWSSRSAFQRRVLLVLAILGVAGALAIVTITQVHAERDGPKITTQEQSEKPAPISAGTARQSQTQKQVVEQEVSPGGSARSARQRLTSVPYPSGRFDVCTTLQCILSAEMLASAMDVTADPCDDFFQFACGGWLQKNAIPESMYMWGRFSELSEQALEEIRRIVEKPKTMDDPTPLTAAKDMYTACMNTDLLETIGLKPLTDLISQYSGWPMVMEDWDNKAFDWQKVTAEGRRRAGEAWLYTIYVYLDHKDTDHSSIYISESTLGLARSFLVDPDSYGAIVSLYKTLMVKTAQVLRDHLGSGVSDAQIVAEAEKVFQFETDIAKITTAQEDNRNISSTYHPYLLPELQQMTDDVQASQEHAKPSWKKILDMVFQDTGVTVSDSERVIVTSPDYIGNLTQLLDKTDKKTIANYLGWRLVLSWAGETTQKMRDLLFSFDQAVMGIAAKKDRWQKCVGLVQGYLGMAVSYEYINNVFDEDSKHLTLDMINDLRAAFKEQVNEAEWMDEQTKALAQDKADSMHELIGYPDWLKNKTALEVLHEGMSMAPDQHFRNLYNQRGWTSHSELSTLRDVTDRNDAWIFPPAMVNAAYLPNFNALMFPAAILQPPFFKKDRTAALNYGGIGAIIGHELTHGFDNQGRQFDKYGNVAQWWTVETMKAYQEKVQCFIDQYGSYHVPELVQFMGTENAKLNGQLTQGENIADNGGLRQAFRAYRKFISDNGREPRLPGLIQYTPEHLFFLAYANNWCEKITDQGLLTQVLTDPHSPAKYRVWGPISNSEDFSKTWGCKVGQAMSSPKKCVLW